MKAKIPYNKAYNLAQRILKELEPGCSRIEIRGSLHRKKPMVGDIEILAIPKIKNMQLDFFGNASGIDTKLDDIITRLVSVEKRLMIYKNGKKYKNLLLPKANVQLDLFLTDSLCWPIISAIRTGSSLFSKKIVTQQNKGGFLNNSFSINGGRLIDGAATPVALESELHFFKDYLSCGWVRPQEREL